MADSSRIAQLKDELATLRRQHLEAINAATYIGWTTESIAVHDELADRIEGLISRLSALEKKP